jgi:transcriptional regulator with XRE-family HTH domain
MSTEESTIDNFLHRLTYLVEERLGGNWAELSRISGLSGSSIHKIKNGSEPKLTSLEKICNALNVSLDWLVTGRGEISCLDNEAVNDAAADKESAMLLEMIMALPPAEKSTALSLLKSQFSAFEQKKQLDALIKEVAELRQKAG